MAIYAERKKKMIYTEFIKSQIIFQRLIVISRSIITLFNNVMRLMSKFRQRNNLLIQFSVNVWRRYDFVWL